MNVWSFRWGTRWHGAHLRGGGWRTVWPRWWDSHGCRSSTAEIHSNRPGAHSMPDLSISLFKTPPWLPTGLKMKSVIVMATQLSSLLQSPCPRICSNSSYKTDFHSSSTIGPSHSLGPVHMMCLLTAPTTGPRPYACKVHSSLYLSLNAPLPKRSSLGPGPLLIIPMRS